MKKIIASVLIFGIMAFCAPMVSAGIWTFSPTPADLYDLDHYYAYSWGVNWGTTEEIVDVKLIFHNIRDWTVESNDILYVRLLDQVAEGVHKYEDWQGGGDYFASQGVLIDTWTDPYGTPYPAVTLEWSFADLGLVDDFALAASDGNWGLSFDPDCHYFNSGIEIQVETADAIPEPASLSLMLMGMGMIGSRFLKRKK